MPGLPGDDQCHRNRGDDHNGTQGPVVDSPAGILDQPKQDMEVFHPAKAGRYRIHFGILHAFLFLDRQMYVFLRFTDDPAVEADRRKSYGEYPRLTSLQDE
jgi:hypothetical protein